MIDKNGYIKLIDFGTAKIVDDYTSTVIGTPQYTAPEVMKGKGYSMSCDYWTIGVIAYEIFYGKIPFGNNSGNDIVAIYNSILHDQPQFSTNVNYKSIDDFIRMLLEKKVNKRICSFNLLRKAKIFEFDRESDLRSSTGTYMNKDYFEMIINLEIKPPYMPITKDWKVSSLKGDCENVVSYFKKIQYDDISTVHSSINKESAEGRQDAKWVEQF
jgi:serine/threonine protein kinase